MLEGFNNADFWSLYIEQWNILIMMFCDKAAIN